LPDSKDTGEKPWPERFGDPPSDAEWIRTLEAENRQFKSSGEATLQKLEATAREKREFKQQRDRLLEAIRHWPRYANSSLLDDGSVVVADVDAEFILLAREIEAGEQDKAGRDA
jgi:hypothetical protein